MPSEHTYWPGVNPGPLHYDLDGTGAWFSDNAHILVLVSESGVINISAARRTFNIDLVDLLDRALACWVTFDWAFFECFEVESSELERVALCES